MVLQGQLLLPNVGPALAGHMAPMFFLYFAFDERTSKKYNYWDISKHVIRS